jgi:tRNA pseudouridine55 synthase
MKSLNEMSLEDFQSGQVLLVDKALGWTSFDVVNKIRHSLRHRFQIKKIKVGHAGTLDPLATGLLVVCIGKATKRMDELMGLDKEYLADIRFGGTTPTFDKEMPVDREYPWEHITKQKLNDVLTGYIGIQEQTPPDYSAVRVEGKKAYERARKGQRFAMKSRQIRLYELEMINIDLPDISLRIRCSKGTYIRALARDLGLAMGSGAYLTALQRTAIGNYTLSKAQSIEDVAKQISGM